MKAFPEASFLLSSHEITTLHRYSDHIPFDLKLLLTLPRIATVTFLSHDPHSLFIRLLKDSI